MKSDYYSKKNLDSIGFKSIGSNCKISKGAKFYNPELIEIGNNIRIDTNTVITASNDIVKFGSYIHISANCYINGSYGLEFRDFTALSAGSNIFTSSDDYSGKFMTNPTIPSNLTNSINKKVIINKYVNIGSNTVIMPGVKIGEGSVIGALSFVTKSVGEWGIYFGSPVKRIGNRKKNVIKLSEKLESYEKKI